jgi:hypothetical protein
MIAFLWLVLLSKSIVLGNTSLLKNKIVIINQRCASCFNNKSFLKMYKSVPCFEDGTMISKEEKLFFCRWNWIRPLPPKAS